MLQQRYSGSSVIAGDGGQSRSSSRTRRPVSASSPPRLAASVVFPTLPLVEATHTTRITSGLRPKRSTTHRLISSESQPTVRSPILPVSSSNNGNAILSRTSRKGRERAINLKSGLSPSLPILLAEARSCRRSGALAAIVQATHL